MSPKIVFNGQEYDGVESMPEDVRRQYEAALNALSAADRDKLESAVEHGAKFQLKVNVRKRIKINGKEYGSVDEMPSDVRAVYERALEGNPALRDTATSIPTTTRSPGPTPAVPPAIDADEGRRGALFRIALWVVVGLAVLIWLLSRR